MMRCASAGPIPGSDFQFFLSVARLTWTSAVEPDDSRRLTGIIERLRRFAEPVDVDVVAVVNQRRQIDPFQIGVRGSATSSRQRIVNPAARRQRHDTRPAG